MTPQRSTQPRRCRSPSHRNISNTLSRHNRLHPRRCPKGQTAPHRDYLTATICCLSWTNYDDTFILLRLSPIPANVASTLELTFCNMDVHHLKAPLRGDSGPALYSPPSVP